MKSQSFFESQQELAEKFGQLSLRYKAQGLLLNKLVADLHILEKDIDNTEVIQLLGDECDELRATEGEGSAIYKKKSTLLGLSAQVKR